MIPSTIILFLENPHMLPTYLDLMKEFIAFRSISTDAQYKNDMILTAEYLVALLQTYGFEAQAIPWYGNPIVVASYIVDKALPTHLVYWHYDVQPASLEEWWEQDPFDLHVQDEKIVARWAVDNKWQIMIHIATIGKLIQEWRLQYNIKFMIEWDEETWSPYLVKFLEDYKDLLAADVVVVSDGEIIWDHTPTIWAGFRGGCNMTVTVKTADVDLHSWLYGWIAPNSALEAMKLLAKLYTQQHRIAIDNYYDTVDPITEDEIANNVSLPISHDDIKNTTWIKNLLIQEWYDAVSANGLMPTIQITWLQSWYTGEWYRNAIPHKTTIKINFRFARWQKPADAIAQFIARSNEQTPDYVSLEFDISDPYEAITIKTDHPSVQKARTTLLSSHGVEPVLRFCGAAIPVTWLFQDILWSAVVIVDLANEDCRMHGVGENFRIICIQKWLDFSEQFFST